MARTREMSLSFFDNIDVNHYREAQSRRQIVWLHTLRICGSIGTAEPCHSAGLIKARWARRDTDAARSPGELLLSYEVMR